VKKANFNALLESVKQAGEIVRGERAPAREFHIDADSIKRLRQKSLRTRLKTCGTFA
jgi:putative transcriptional regulator